MKWTNLLLFTAVKVSATDNCIGCKTDCHSAFAYDSANPLRNLCLMEFVGLDEWGFEVLNFNIKDFAASESDSDDSAALEHSESKTLTLDLYTGAKDCNLDVGMIIGEVAISYDSAQKELSMAFHTDAPYVMTEVSSYAGYDILPQTKNGYHTARPNEFDAIYAQSQGFTQYTFKHAIGDSLANFNIIAHAVVHDSSKPLQESGADGNSNDVSGQAEVV